MGVKISKHYSSSQNDVGDYRNFVFLTFNNFFFENFKFTIVTYEERKTSNFWKMGDRRAKLNEIWDSQVLLQHIWDTFGLVGLKVISSSFGALVIFPKVPFSKKHYFFYKSQPNLI